MQAVKINSILLGILVLGGMTLPGGSVAVAGDYPISEPLEETVVVREQLVSGESDDVPPEPTPPAEYHPLGSPAPALVADEILRLRDSLGAAPLTGRAGFRPLTLANESDEAQATPAPWERENDRRDFRDRLQGMASRPILPQPHGVPYGAGPYHFNTTPFATQPVPQIYLQPQPVQIPYGFETVQEGCHGPMGAPSFMVAESHGEKQIDILRQTAHQLEETAHQLECCEQFDRADQVRRLADLLRQDARRGRRAEEATAMRVVRPAATVSADHTIRAALRARPAGRTSEAAEIRQSEAGSLETEPSCPACPTLERTRRGAVVETPAASDE